MPSIKIPNEEMIEILGNKEFEISDQITRQSRWSTYHKLIFRHGGKIYRTTYSHGSTEVQDESAFDGGGDVECFEVRAVEKMTTVYEDV